MTSSTGANGGPPSPSAGVASAGSGLLRRLFGSEVDNEGLWQDREIRFDSNSKLLVPVAGEKILQSVVDVEDTKGNNGEKGALLVSNLRLMWISEKNKRTNLSVGYNCIVNLSMKGTNSRLKGNTQAIHCLTKFNGSRFEFIFTSIVDNGPELFQTIQTVYTQYDMTRLYRDLKLRGNIMSDKELKILPSESLYSKVNGVWNLSSEQGNLGSFFITSVRVVWHANLAPTFNVSIPYVQIQSIRLRDSKFGQALVIETTPRSGSYILGFKLDPASKLEEVSKEIQALFQVYKGSPNFGVNQDAKEGAAAAAAAATAAVTMEDDVAVVEAEAGNDLLSSYYADGWTPGDRNAVFSLDLGLAIEPLQDGITVEQLWNVL